MTTTNAAQAAASVMSTKAQSNIGRHFRLIGRTEIFRVVHETHNANACGIHAVTGWTLDERRQTQPRVADIEWVEWCGEMAWRKTSEIEAIL